MACLDLLTSSVEKTSRIPRRKGNKIEDESAEQSVFRIGYEVAYLFGSTSQDYRDSRIVDFQVFSIFATAHTDCFMMERLAEQVGVIAMLGFERLAKRVTLGLKE